MIKYENEPFKQHIFRFCDVNGSEFMAQNTGNGYIIMENDYPCLVICGKELTLGKQMNGLPFQIGQRNIQ